MYIPLISNRFRYVKNNFWKKLHILGFLLYTWFVTYFIIFIFQLLFNVFKVLEIKYTYENKLIPLLLNTVWINLLSIGSVYYSLEGLLSGDVFVIVFYVGGGVCGKWLAIKKIDNIRGKIFKFIFGS